MVTSNATYRANEGTKNFTVKLVGWDSNRNPYTIVSVVRTGYKIANDVYVILAVLEPTTESPLPSNILNYITVENINSIIGATIFSRAAGQEYMAVPQYAGDQIYLRSANGDNWLPIDWRSANSPIVQVSLIVKL